MLPTWEPNKEHFFKELFTQEVPLESTYSSHCLVTSLVTASEEPSPDALRPHMLNLLHLKVSGTSSWS